MKKIFGIIAATFITLAASSAAQAVELVMVDSRACTFCAKFKREVAPEYRAKAGRNAAALRRVSTYSKWPADLASVKRTPFAPVFILVDDGREIGRFFGYSNRQTFYAQLDKLMNKR